MDIMLLTYLIIPFCLIALLLLLLKNNRVLFVIALSSIFVSIQFMLVFSFTRGYDDISFIMSFVYPLYSTTFLFILCFVLGMIFTLAQKKVNYKELGYIILYFCCAMGIIFADKFSIMITFWEAMAVVSTLIILQSHENNKVYIAFKYLVIHIFGGTLILLGASNYLFSFNSDIIPPDGSLALNNIGNYLILCGILVNLAVPPFSSWLSDGYSKCSPIASVFLCIFTTNSALFMLIKLFYGTDLLIYIGIFTASYGLFFSIIQTSIRRMLALSVIHQIGIILIGVASIKYFDGFFFSYIAVSALYKMGLFMFAAILIKEFQTDNIYHLKNIINLKSILGVVFLIISLQSLCLPITSGYIVKSYITESVSSVNKQWLDMIMLFLLAGVALNIGIRLPFYIINFKNTSDKMKLEKKVLNIPFLLSIVILQGFFLAHSYLYFNITSIINAFELLSLGIMLFILINYFSNGKEKNLLKLIEQGKDKLVMYTIKVLRIISSDKLQSKLVGSIMFVYDKSSEKINHNQLTPGVIVSLSLVLLLLLYSVFRISH